jgi:hypothetical protein
MRLHSDAKRGIFGALRKHLVPKFFFLNIAARENPFGMSTKNKAKPARGAPPAQRKAKKQPASLAASNNTQTHSAPGQLTNNKQITCPVCSTLGPARDYVTCLVCNGKSYFFLPSVPVHRRCSKLQKSSYVCKICCIKQPRKTALKRYVDLFSDFPLSLRFAPDPASSPIDGMSTATLIDFPRTPVGHKFPPSTPKKSPRAIYSGKQPRKQSLKSSKGFKAAPMALKSTLYRRDPSPIPVLPPVAAAASEDEDLCMVCDGDCDCKSGSPPAPVVAVVIPTIILEPLKDVVKQRKAPVVRSTSTRPKRGTIVKEEEESSFERVERKRKRAPVVVVEKKVEETEELDSFEMMSDSSEEDEDEVMPPILAAKGRKAKAKPVVKKKAVVTPQEELEMMDAVEFENLFNTRTSSSGLSSSSSGLDGLSSSDDEMEAGDDFFMPCYDVVNHTERMNEEDLVEQLFYTGWSSGDDDDVDDFQFLLDGLSSDEEGGESSEDPEEEEEIVDSGTTAMAIGKEEEEECIDPKLIHESSSPSVEKKIEEKKDVKKVEAIVLAPVAPYVPTQSIEIKKSEMGPNGEIVTTTKTIKVPVNSIKRAPTTPIKNKKAPVVGKKKVVMPIVKATPVVLSDTLPENTKLAIQAASASILKSCGITPLPPLDQSYTALASINPYAAAMAMVF